MHKTYKFLFLSLALTLTFASVQEAIAHHVLGRPSYSLNEDSNTPPAIQMETQIGDYLVNVMVFPAFPQPNEPGRISLYASHLDTAVPFDGQVSFAVRNNSWASWLGFDTVKEKIGVQKIDDNVYRQGFLFKTEGDYILTAEFQAGGEPYVIDFPLRIGKRAPIGALGITVSVLFLILASVSIIQRKRAMTGKIQDTHQQTTASPDNPQGKQL